MIFGKKERQIRCLHYCFTAISDWSIRRLKEVRDNYIEEHGHGNTPSGLLNVERDWQVEIDHLMSVMRRSGIDLRSIDYREFLKDDLQRN